MAIPFTHIPIDIRTPGNYVEVDNSRMQAAASIYPTRVIIIGQMEASGSAPPLTPQLVISPAQAVGRYGARSHVAHMIAAFVRANPTLELWAMGVLDVGGGSQAVGQALFAGSATAAGVANLMVGGRRYRAPVTVGMTAVQAATAMVAAINADTSAPFTASNATTPARVDITATHKGLAGNEIDIRTAYYDDDVLAAGLTLTITPMAGGASNPDITAALAALGDMWFTDIVIPWNDGANLAVLQADLVDRFGPMRMQDCHAWRPQTGDLAALSAHGVTRNSPHISVPALYKFPMPPWVNVAAAAAVWIRAMTNDPARPVQTLPIPGILPPVVKDRFSRAQRDILLHKGISTLVVDAGGTVVTERVVTEYQTNAFGAADTSFLNVETVKTISYLRYDIRNFFSTKYPRHKLASDGTQFGRGQPVMTPKLAKAELIGRFAVWEEMGLVENREQFAADLVVERSLTDPDRLDAIIPPDCINGFRVGAFLLQPRL
jgi:phage tail sheath gpL-like